jgi:hypothetical protein
MQTVVFDDELFSRVSGFYKEKDGKWQEKKAKVQVKSYTGAAEPIKVCSVPFNLSDYIDRGIVKESLQLTGNAFFVDFEILIEADTSGDPRASMAVKRESVAGGDFSRSTMQPQSYGSTLLDHEDLKKNKSELDSS